MINCLYILLTLLSTITSQQCHAMEGIPNINKAQVINTLTTVKNPKSVICLENNTVAILGSDALSLCDFSTNTEVHRLFDNNISNHVNITAHPNRKTLAIHNLHNLTICDVQTRKKIYEKDGIANWFSNPTFNPQEDTIFTANAQGCIDSFNYVTNNQSQSYPLSTTIHLPQVTLAFHPTKQELAVVAHDSCTLQILQLNKTPLIEKKICIKEPIKSCIYSPDGSLLAIKNFSQEYFIVDLTAQDLTATALGNDHRPICTMVFHPTSCILATISKPNIYFWNTTTHKCISSISITDENPHCFFGFKCIDFSCDGTKLIVALTDRCLVVEVPFEALYQSGTKEKSIFALLILQRYLCGNIPLPCDIIHTILQYHLAASKY